MERVVHFEGAITAKRTLTAHDDDFSNKLSGDHETLQKIIWTKHFH